MECSDEGETCGPPWVEKENLVGYLDSDEEEMIEELGRNLQTSKFVELKKIGGRL